MMVYTEPLDRPQRYKMTTGMLCASLGRPIYWINQKCNRFYDTLPHIVIAQGQRKQRFFDPKEVAEWMARQTS